MNVVVLIHEAFGGAASSTGREEAQMITDDELSVKVYHRTASLNLNIEKVWIHDNYVSETVILSLTFFYFRFPFLLHSNIRQSH